MSKILFNSNQIMFFDNVQAENQKILNVFSVQTLNRFAFKKVTDVVKKIKKNWNENIKKNNIKVEDKSRSQRLIMLLKNWKKI